MCEFVFFVALVVAAIYLWRHPPDDRWPPPDGCGSPFFLAGR